MSKSARMEGLFLVAGLALAAVSAALGGGCSAKSGDLGTPCTPDLESIRKTVFAPSCAGSGCHNANDRSAGLDLTAPDLSAELVGVSSGTCEGSTRVVPGSPDTSLLYGKVAGTPACGAHMPLGGAELPSNQKECLRQWIAALGAPDGGAPDVDCGDTQSSASNCGSCGNACPTGASCTSGKCACASPLEACGSSCVDTRTSAGNCGSCGNACPTGANCTAGQCACPSGASTVCGGACVDTASDPKNCGRCGNPCTGAAPLCFQGQCGTSCGALTACGGACVDTKTSIANCGGCNKVCPSGASCNNGICQCPTGTSACNGACIDTVSNPSNCGACGTVCPSGTTCASSKCACANGGTLCGSACALTATDPSNCGACGKVCAPGQTCTNGACTCGTASVSFASAVQPIFTSSCAVTGCHTGVAPKEGLNLASGKSYAGLVNVRASECSDGRLRVKPNEPATSYLVQKLTNQSLCSGSQMPKAGSSLPSAQLQAITNWICAGALNN